MGFWKKVGKGAAKAGKIAGSVIAPDLTEEVVETIGRRKEVKQAERSAGELARRLQQPPAPKVDGRRSTMVGLVLIVAGVAIALDPEGTGQIFRRFIESSGLEITPDTVTVLLGSLGALLLGQNGLVSKRLK